MEKETLFLTIDQTLEAIRRDFVQYEPQMLLFAELLRLISDDQSAFKREPGEAGIWIRPPGGSHMRFLDGKSLVDYMCALIDRLKYRADPDLIADVAGRVFQTRVRQAGPGGFGIETGMERFVCRQCGRCCRDLDYHAEVTEQDVARWRARDRADILKWVGVTRHRDGRETYRIWVIPGTNRFAEPCPFLKKIPTRHAWICRIHEIKPLICRAYPVSKKHALMTDCSGFK
jgi:Fe-S-cluster containining protein